MTVVAIADAPAHTARIEVQAARVARIALEERTRPIVAVGTDTANRSTIAVACRRQKYAVAVGFACHFAAIDSVLGGPCPSAVVS